MTVTYSLVEHMTETWKMVDNYLQAGFQAIIFRTCTQLHTAAVVFIFMPNLPYIQQQLM